MSKDLHNNERYLKELSDKYNPAPPPMIWDEIEQVLDKDKPKRRLFLLLLIFGILSFGAILMFNLKATDDKELAKTEQEIIHKINKKQSVPKANDLKTIESTTNNNLNQIKKENNINGTKISVSKIQEGGKINSNGVNNYQSKGSNRYPPERSLKLNTNSSNSNVTSILTTEEKNKPKEIFQIKEVNFQERALVQFSLLKRLEWVKIPFEAEIFLPELNTNLTANFTANLNPEPMNNSSFASPWFVELGGGIGRNLINPTLIDPTQGGFRLNTETNWYSWSTAINIGYQFNNGWYTSMGIDFNQTKNKFDFWRRDVSNLLIVDNQSLQFSKSDFYNIGEIRYTFADIGLSIGKRIEINNKFYFSLEGGLIFNALFNANGKVQVGVLEFSRLENEQNYFNSSIGIGARFSAMIDYPLSDNIWISLGPSYHQYFNTISTNANPLEERNAILQGKAKVRYCF